MPEAAERAIGEFTYLVVSELRHRTIPLPDFACRRPKGGFSVIERVVDLRQPERCYADELRRLVDLLFRLRSKRHYQAHQCVNRFAKSRGKKKPLYNNRKRACRGKRR
jgi:hypothetical protein